MHTKYIHKHVNCIVNGYFALNCFALVRKQEGELDCPNPKRVVLMLPQLVPSIVTAKHLRKLIEGSPEVKPPLRSPNCRHSDPPDGVWSADIEEDVLVGKGPIAHRCRNCC